MASNIIARAYNVMATASNLIAMASNPIARVSKQIAMASYKTDGSHQICALLEPVGVCKTMAHLFVAGRIMK